MGESKRVVLYRASQSGSSKIKQSGQERGVAPCVINDPWHGYRQKLRVFFREADYGVAGAMALSPMSAATVGSMASAHRR
jgi:hypothetical protein